MIRNTLPSVSTVTVSAPADLDRLVDAVSGNTALHTYAVGHQGEHLYVSERLVISPGAGVFEPVRRASSSRPGRRIEVGTLLGTVSAQRGPLAVRRPPGRDAGPPGRAGPDRPADRLAARIMTGAAITGWGTALPERIVTNADITTLFETSDEWIVERSGIHTRQAATGPFVAEQPPHHPESGLGTTATLAVEAGRQALDHAGLDGSDIGLLMLCTTTPDQLIPASSGGRLGRPRHRRRGHGPQRRLRRLHLRPGHRGRARRRSAWSGCS